MIFYDHFYFLQQPFKFLPIKSSMRSVEKLTFEGPKVIDRVCIMLQFGALQPSPFQILI